MNFIDKSMLLQPIIKMVDAKLIDKTNRGDGYGWKVDNFTVKNVLADYIDLKKSTIYNNNELISEPSYQYKDNQISKSFFIGKFVCLYRLNLDMFFDNVEKTTVLKGFFGKKSSKSSFEKVINLDKIDNFIELLEQNNTNPCFAWNTDRKQNLHIQTVQSPNSLFAGLGKEVLIEALETYKKDNCTAVFIVNNSFVARIGNFYSEIFEEEFNSLTVKIETIFIERKEYPEKEKVSKEREDLESLNKYFDNESSER